METVTVTRAGIDTPTAHHQRAAHQTRRPCPTLHPPQGSDDAQNAHTGPDGAPRRSAPATRRRKRMATTAAIAAALAATAFGVRWILTHPIEQGGAFRLTMRDPASGRPDPDSGHYVLLYHRQHTADDTVEWFAALTGSHVGPTTPSAQQTQPHQPQDTMLDAAFDVAWIVAGARTATPTPHRTRNVVVWTDDARVTVGSLLADDSAEPRPAVRTRRQGTITVIEPFGSRTTALNGAVTTITRYDFDTPRPIPDLTSGLKGTSAGLVATLAYLDLLAAGELHAGLTVAATGTIDTSGQVGAIGDVGYKTEAALAAGADVVFVPTDNVAEARRSAGTRKADIVAVASVDDVIAWLCAHGATTTSLCAAFPQPAP